MSSAISARSFSSPRSPMWACRMRATLWPTRFDIRESWSAILAMACFEAFSSRATSPSISLGATSFRGMANSSSERTNASPIAYPGETPIPLRISIRFPRAPPPGAASIGFFHPEPAFDELRERGRRRLRVLPLRLDDEPGARHGGDHEEVEAALAVEGAAVPEDADLRVEPGRPLREG